MSLVCMLVDELLVPSTIVPWRRTSPAEWVSEGQGGSACLMCFGTDLTGEFLFSWRAMAIIDRGD